MPCFSRTLLALGAAFLVAASGLPQGASAAKHSANSDSSKALGHIQTGANNTLVCVQVVSRHGTRAPNPVVSKLCPADRENLALYAHLRITLAGLTGTGMSELYDMGVFTRQQYIERTYPGFISSFFNDQEVYFRAVGEDRTLQSAAAMGQGMYPEGSAPIGYKTDIPSPVPVYTLPDVYDNLLEVRKQGCKAQLAKDAAAWDRESGVKLYEANQPLLARMHALCNITDLNDVTPGSGDNYGDAIKDITDAWTFDMNEGFHPQDGLNVSSLLEFRTLAVEQLLGRIVGTDEQITYMNGELPERMLDNFLFSVWNQGSEHVAEFALRMYAYHGHREMMYALAAFLGIEFDIKFPALPRGAIPPATTLFFELHYVGERDPETGAIPNAFVAAGLENPYAQGGSNQATPNSDKSLPWELQRKSGSTAAREQGPQHQHQDDKEREDDEKPSEEEEGGAAAGKEGKEGKEQAVVPRPLAKTLLFGSDELSEGHGAPFNKTEEGKDGKEESESEEGTSPAESEGEYKYLPRSARRAAPGAAPAPRKAAPSYKPAPPTDGYVVRALLWHPCRDDEKDAPKPTSGKKGGKHSSSKKQEPSPDCPAVPVAMSAVCDGPAEEGCTLAQLGDAIHERLQRTGTWAQLCHAKDVRRIMADSKGLAHAANHLSLPSAARVVTTPSVVAGQGSQGLTPRQAQLRRQRLRRELEERRRLEDEALAAEEEQELANEQAEEEQVAEEEAEEQQRVAPRTKPVRPFRGTRPAPRTPSQADADREDEVAPRQAVTPAPPAPSHPILRTFLFLLLAAPLCALCYVLYIRYRQSEYQGFGSGRNGGSAASGAGSLQRGGDIEVQQAERVSLVH